MSKDIFRTLTKQEKLNRHNKSKKEAIVIPAKEKHKFTNKKFIPYHEQLIDKRWLKRRKEVFQVKGRKCSICGSTINLQVHHLRYLNNKYAWEYKMKDLVVLCHDCHKRKHCIDLDERLDFLLRNEL